MVVERVDRERDLAPSPEMWDLAFLEGAEPLRPSEKRDELQGEVRRRTVVKPNAPHPIC